MKMHGVEDGIISAGGSTIDVLNAESHFAWDVFVPDPAGERPSLRIALDNRGCATASLAETFVPVAGRRYRYIPDPGTGRPSSNRPVCVVDDSGLAGDVVSTGLFNETVDGFLHRIAFLPKSTLSKVF